MRDVECHSWPSVDNLNFTVLRARISEDSDKARFAIYVCKPLFCRVLDLFGMEDALMKLYSHPAVIEAAVAHIAEYLLAINEINPSELDRRMVVYVK